MSPNKNLKRELTESTIEELNIDIGDSTVNTTYGVYKENAFQDKDYYKSICEELGFYLIAESLDNNQFYLHFKK